MTKNLTIYILSLLAAFMVYWMFGTMMTVSAGPTNYVPVISFWASVIQFGLGSWLFMHLVKTGRLIGITFGILTILWPMVALVSSFEFGIIGTLLFGIPVGLTIIVVFGHIKRLNDPKRPNVTIRTILSVLPFGLFVAYIIYLFRLGYFG